MCVGAFVLALWLVKCLLIFRDVIKTTECTVAFGVY